MRDGQEIINDDKCKTEELENIAMILSGISDNMFSAQACLQVIKELIFCLASLL